MKRKWIYLMNFMDPKGPHNYTRALKIVTHHNDALRNQRSNEDIGIIFDRTDPLVAAYTAEMKNKLFSKCVSTGQVETFDNLKAQLPLTLAKWDGRIQSFFEVDTITYKNLFVVHRSELYIGPIEVVITKLETFHALVAQQTVLAVIAADILVFINKLKAARDLKGEKSGDIDAKSIELDVAYDAVTLMIYRNLGRLIDLYGDDSERIAQFFDLALIRYHSSESPNAGLIIEIFALSRQVWEPEFTAENIMTMHNKMPGSVYYFFAATADEAEPEKLTELYPNEMTDFKGSVMLAANKKFVVFVNKHNSMKVKVEVKVEKP